MGVTILISLRKDNKGTISVSNDHFSQRNWGEFQEKHLISPVDSCRVIKIANKTILTTKGAFLLLLR